MSLIFIGKSMESKTSKYLELGLGELMVRGCLRGGRGNLFSPPNLGICGGEFESTSSLLNHKCHPISVLCGWGV